MDHFRNKSGGELFLSINQVGYFRQISSDDHDFDTVLSPVL
jgi:hypothetical protein